MNELIKRPVDQGILPRILGRFDLVTIYFTLIFGSYGAAQLAGKGWAGISMLLLAVVTFLIPCALASYELGTLFPGEGGIYMWAKKTLGIKHGFIAGWLSWVPVFLLLPLISTTIVAHIQFIFSIKFPLWYQVILQVAVIWIIYLISIKKLKFSQGYVRILSIVAFATAGIAYGVAMIKGHSVNPINREIFSLDLNKYGTLYSAAILWLLGVEVPYNMGDEFSEHKKTAGSMILWGSLALVIAYIFGIIGVLYTTSLDQVNPTIGIAQGVANVYPILGIVVAFLICLAVSSQGVAYMNAYSRLLFVSGLEKCLPESYGNISKNKIPTKAMLVQVIGATIVLIIFSTQANLVIAFNLYLAALVAVWCASLFYIYIGVVLARRNLKHEYEERGENIWKLPFGKIGLWFTAIWGFFFNMVAIYYVFANPWVDGISKSSWMLWLSIISFVVVASGTVVFKLNRK